MNLVMERVFDRYMPLFPLFMRMLWIQPVLLLISLIFATMLEILLLLASITLVAYTNHRIAIKRGMKPLMQWHLQLMFIYHLAYSVFFTFYILDHGGDALAYWTLSTNVMPAPSEHWGDYFGLSTFFIQWLNFVPWKILGFSFMTGNVLYGLLGFLGIRFLFLLSYDHFIKEVPFRHQVYFLPIFYLPNMHFWTSGIGKEAVTLFALAGLLYGLTYIRRAGWLAVLCWGILFLVRPHIGWLVLGLVLLVWLFSPVFSKKMKVAILIGMGGLLLMLYPLLVRYLNIPDFSYASLRWLMDYQIDFLQHESVGSSVDIASYNQLERVLTYLFRPLFYDAYHWQTYLASMENLIYIVLFVLFFACWNLAALRQMPLFLKVGLLFFVVTSLIFANSLSNLGIMMRMKSFTMIFLAMGAGYMVGCLYFQQREG